MRVKRLEAPGRFKSTSHINIYAARHHCVDILKDDLKFSSWWLSAVSSHLGIYHLISTMGQEPGD